MDFQFYLELYLFIMLVGKSDNVVFSLVLVPYISPLHEIARIYRYWLSGK